MKNMLHNILYQISPIHENEDSRTHLKTGVPKDTSDLEILKQNSHFSTTSHSTKLSVSDLTFTECILCSFIAGGKQRYERALNADRS